MVDERTTANTNGRPGQGKSTTELAEPIRYPLAVRRAMAMSRAKCGHCGITAGGHPDLVKRTSTKGPILYMKCLSCGTNFKIVVPLAPGDEVDADGNGNGNGDE